mgnify:CR=1 FL=1|jgi:small GTP-binding protein
MELIKDNLKVLFLGNSSVGKTTLINSYVTQVYDDHIEPTIGLDYKSTIIDNTILQLYDTSGQDRFRALVKSYYRSANVILLIFSLNNIETLNEIDTFWLPNCRELCKNPLYILIGNKCDKTNDTNILHSIKELTQKYNIRYIETSAKTLYNVNLIFETIIEQYDKKNNYLLVHKDTIPLLTIKNEDIDSNDDYCCIIS